MKHILMYAILISMKKPKRSFVALRDMNLRVQSTTATLAKPKP